MNGPRTSPWVWASGDYLQRQIQITVNYNQTTDALISAVIHRDDGCLWHNIVLDNPSDAVKAKLLPAPADGQGDVTYTAAQMSARGLNTYSDVTNIQITAIA